jgi:hypothetical protein
LIAIARNENLISSIGIIFRNASHALHYVKPYKLSLILSAIILLNLAVDNKILLRPIFNYLESKARSLTALKITESLA